MNGYGNENGCMNNSLHKEGESYRNSRLPQAQTHQQGNTEKRHIMETLDRGYSDLYRNSSEEIVLKSLMENPMGISAPSMEMLGFKNISQTLRGDSEELFNSWLLNGEIPGFISSNGAHRTRATSRRISTEPAVSSFQQNDSLFQQNTIEEHSADPSRRNIPDKGIQASNLYLAKAWFQSTQPMTRSRSSELRRRYAAMQNMLTPTVVEAPNDTPVPGRGSSIMKHEFAGTSNFCDVSMVEMPTQLHTFMSPSNSSTSPFNTPPMATVDTVSSVVSMLKGTLERKKLGNQADKETLEGNCFVFSTAAEVASNIGSHQDAAGQLFEPTMPFHMVSSIHMNDLGKLQKVETSLELNVEGFVSSGNQIQLGVLSQEPSQSESSAAAPVISTGFEVCDDPAQSAQTLSVCENSRKCIGNGTTERGPKAREFRERMLENNFKDDRKKGNLVRMGSVSSGGTVDKGDPTKKRRVERSRKMAEAKERNSTPALPSDMQSVLKRCENLEKEVRSLKLNLSFMNRKDSEQTKQIEELQKQNEDLAEEKERLLEEIERIISETNKM
ncbi:hypothetical protein IHE45_01G096600 [Dioscorea alata]|uniref:Uncharacterized protein n=1 Tax=Dioscorea alata TaxID=55571 RepID=A0ACB7WWG0_DIOAL|nr:hypothetical protein IHE45_01G096600 [Dioscorea alata]